MSPTMQDSKFEVIMSSESDLEEGEIPEFDFLSSKPQVEDGEIPDDYYRSRSSERLRSKFKMKHEKEYLDNDYSRQEKLPEAKRKLREYKQNYKSNKSSSDGEISDVERKDSKKISLTIRNSSAERKLKQRHTLKGSYGTVEDIMTQIDATLCRKSLCNYKRRKSREIQFTSERNHRTRSSSKDPKPRIRHCRPKKSSSSESESDNVFSRNKKPSRNKIPVCKRKREKELKRIKEVVYICSDDSSDDDSAPRKKGSAVKKNRDFDEYRKELLEKLSKEKSDSKSNCENIPLPAEELSNSSDIQEIEMMDDSNAFVDDKAKEASAIKPPEATSKSFMDSFYVTRNVPQAVSEPQESEGEDDDTELIKLRLLALTSNRKKKEAVSDDASNHSLDLEQSSNVDVKSEENLSDKEEQDSDLDRNEFLLRAEALKTALLRKHKLKKAKENVEDNAKSDKFTEITEEKLKVNEEIIIQAKVEAPESINVPEVPTEPKEIKCEISSPGENVNPLEIARRKLLKVYNVLRMSDGVSSNSEIKEDSLQARLLALANETSLPKPSNLSDQKEMTENPTPDNFPKPNLKKTNSAAGVMSRKWKKRLRYKMRKRLRQKKKRKSKMELNTGTHKENEVDSTKLEDDDEKLRVQLLNDLSRKKLSKINDNLQPLENKTSEIVENKPLIDKQIINVKNNKNSNKVAPLAKVPKAEIQRIIVHLGPDSSDDEDLEPEVKPPSLVVPSEEKALEEVPSSTVSSNVNPMLADYERSVELLLQKARQEVEGRKEKNQKSVTATPEAVYKHLPPSQRLEYMRLKQKIAEKENLKKKTAATDSNPSQTKSEPNKNSTSSNLNGIKRVVTASLRPFINDNQLSPKSSISSSVNLQSPSNSTKKIVNHSPIKCDNQDSNQPLKSNSVNKPVVKAALRGPVKTINSQVASKIGSPVAPGKKILASPLNGKKPVVSPEQRKIVAQNQANISRLKLLLKKIKIEKTVEERYEKEIQKLKNQLNLLELKRKQQRIKIETLAKQSKTIYATFQSNRTDVKKLNDEGKVVADGKEKTEDKKESELENNVNKEEHVEVETSNIESKEISEKCENKTDVQVKLDSECEVKVELKSEPKNEGSTENQTDQLPSSSNAPDLKEYNSPLQAFTARTEDTDSKRIDPNAIMCQYDLLGKCNDKECTFQHYRTS